MRILLSEVVMIFFWYWMKNDITFLIKEVKSFVFITIEFIIFMNSMMGPEYFRKWLKHIFHLKEWSGDAFTRLVLTIFLDRREKHHTNLAFCWLQVVTMIHELFIHQLSLWDLRDLSMKSCLEIMHVMRTQLMA